MSVPSGGTYEIDPKTGQPKRVGDAPKTLSRAEQRAIEHEKAAKAEAAAKAEEAKGAKSAPASTKPATEPTGSPTEDPKADPGKPPVRTVFGGSKSSKE